MSQKQEQQRRPIELSKNRSADAGLSSESGEHVIDATGKLQYLPFAQCKEQGARPLELRFLEGEPAAATGEYGLNCTVPAISDEMYHLLEFYVHHDSPLSCRVRARPAGEGELIVAADGEEAGAWVPLSKPPLPRRRRRR